MKNNFYISFGIWLFIIPFLGIPGSWKDMLFAVSGGFLVIVALGPIVLKKLQSRPKNKKKTVKVDLDFSSEKDQTELSTSLSIDNKPKSKEENKV